MQFKQDVENSIEEGHLSLIGCLPSKQLSKECSLKCIGDNMAVQMCLNDQCKRLNIFQCFNSTCKCQMMHHDCQMGKSKRVLNLLDSKISNIQKFNQTINDFINKKIHELQTLRQTLLKMVEKELKYIDLGFLENRFLKLIKSEIKVEDFSSLESKKVWESLSEDLQKSIASTKINPYFKCFDQNLTKNIEELIRNIRDITKEKEKEEGTKMIQFEIMKRSAICTTENMAQRFIKIFGKQIRKLSYLFRASQNDFNIKKYFDGFGSAQNTVLVCKTNKEKIIGAYTSLAHDSSNSNKLVEDPSGESFIFSLTDQEKFNLKNKSGAIFRRKNRDYIIFGNSELMICDKANSTDNCWSNVNLQYYHCPAYSKYDKAAYLKFNGNQTYKFTTKEWEVWKVEF